MKGVIKKRIINKHSRIQIELDGKISNATKEFELERKRAGTDELKQLNDKIDLLTSENSSVKEENTNLKNIEKENKILSVGLEQLQEDFAKAKNELEKNEKDLIYLKNKSITNDFLEKQATNLKSLIELREMELKELRNWGLSLFLQINNVVVAPALAKSITNILESHLIDLDRFNEYANHLKNGNHKEEESEEISNYRSLGLIKVTYSSKINIYTLTELGELLNSVIVSINQNK
jgi:hypothetical protein